MKALTVCQPFADLLLSRHPFGEPMKPIENRTWETKYRGPLVIHAGKSREWMLPGDYERYPDLVFGCVIGLVDLIDCRRLEDLPESLKGHEHAEGPWCWLMSNPRRVKPVQSRGHLNLWEFTGRLNCLSTPSADALARLLSAQTKGMH